MVIDSARRVGVAELGHGQPKPAVGVYDFAVDGGAVGTINLRGQRIPSGAVIVDALFRVDTALAGGTGTDTLALNSEGAGDIQAALARSDALWVSTGAKRVTRTATAAPVLTTALRPIQFVIAGTALTGGVFRVVVWYLELS